METQNIRRGRPRKYTNEQIEKAMSLIRGGSTIAHAARETGMAAQNVIYYKHRNGITGAAVPGVLPTVMVDPLAATESSLLAKYDGEIGRLEATIQKATARLKETVTKRRRVARALGLVESSDPEVTVEPESTSMEEFAKLESQD